MSFPVYDTEQLNAIENIFLSQEMMDFSALLSHQVTQSAWMTRPWAVGLWLALAGASGVGVVWLLPVLLGQSL